MRNAIPSRVSYRLLKGAFENSVEAIEYFGFLPK